MSRKIKQVTNREIKQGEQSQASLDLPQIQNWFAHRILSFEELVWKFLKWALPPDLAALMSDRLPERFDSVIPTGQGREKRVERLWRVWLTTEQSLIVIIEHKSTPAEETSWQLFGYMVEVQRFCKDVHGQIEGVYSVVLYNGDRKWRHPTNFVDLYKLPTAAHPGVLSFRHALADLGATADENLPSDPELRTLLLVFKYCRLVRKYRSSPDLAERITPLVTEVLALRNGVYQGDALVCLGAMAGGDAVIRAVIDGVAPPEHKEEVMSNWMQQHEQKGLEKGLEKGRQEGRKEGRKEGRQEGRQEGRKEGKAETLLAQVETRFGVLSSKLRARIRSADTATLDFWLHRFAEGADRESIFASGRPSAKVIALKSKLSVRRSGRPPAE